MRFGETAPYLGHLFLRELQRALVVLLHHPGDFSKIGLTLRGPRQHAVE
jgi:hypothetical protein